MANLEIEIGFKFRICLKLICEMVWQNVFDVLINYTFCNYFLVIYVCVEIISEWYALFYLERNN